MKRADQLIITGVKPPLKAAIESRAKREQRSISATARMSLESDFTPLKKARKK